MLLGLLATLLLSSAAQAAGSRVADKKAAPLALFPLEVLWRQGLGAPPAVWPGYDATTAYIPLKTGALTAVSLRDGTARWTVENVKVTLSPTVDGGRLYLVGDGTLEARHTETGGAIWQRPTPGAVSAPPVARGGWLIVALDNGDLRALRGETGEMVWELQLGGVVRTEPLIVGDRLYIAPEGSLLMAIDLLSGKTIWERDLGTKVSSIAAHGDRVCAGTIGRMFFGLDERRGEVKWRWRIGGDVIGRPAFDDETAYVIAMDNTMRAFALKDGTQHWREPLEFRPLSGPLRIDAVLLVPGFSPALRGHDTKNGKRVGTFSLPIGEHVRPAAPPVFLEGQSFVDDLVVTATAEGELIAVRRRTSPPLGPIVPLPGTPAPPPTVPTPPSSATAATARPG